MTELFDVTPDPRGHRRRQPSLFDLRQIPPVSTATREQRYPRGYTPERMKEVRGATTDIMSVPSWGPPGMKSEPCPTCAGLGHSPVWKPPEEILKAPWAQYAKMSQGWAERGVERHGNTLSAPGQQCFTCGGKGKLQSQVMTRTEDWFGKPREVGARAMPQGLDHPFYTPHGVRMMQEALARSTVPMEHLKGLAEIGVEPERRVGTQGAGGAWGRYTPSSKRIRLFPVPAKSPKRGVWKGQRVIEPIGQATTPLVAAGLVAAPKTTTEGMVPVRSPSQVQQSEGTLIHEIGHHVSKGPAGPEEEARADRYMVEHWRPDPRDVRRSRAANMRRMTYLGRGTGRYNEQQFREARLPGE